MSQLLLPPPSGLGPAHDGAQDAKLVELWLSLKTSPHTRRAYASEAARFLAFVATPLAWVTLTDLTAWAEHLAAGNLKPASQNRAVTAVKSLREPSERPNQPKPDGQETCFGGRGQTEKGVGSGRLH